jgi:hypothetical protein
MKLLLLLYATAVSFGLARRGFRASIGGVHSLTEENPRRVLIVGATVAERDARQLLRGDK